MAVVLHVPDYGLDGRTPAQLAFDDPDDTALLAGDEDAVRIRRFVATVALVDIGTPE
jgi:hypothetical protein